jgi:hypothetical protein
MTLSQAARSAARALYRARIRHLPLSDFERAFPSIEARTMLSVRRLERLWDSAEGVLHAGIEGDFVECGVARGGSAALVAKAMARAGGDRRLWLFDSFEGMPEPSPELDPDYDVAKAATGACRGDEAEVRALVESVNPAIRLHVVRGLYQDTLKPPPPIERIALLHVDADWYESVSLCLAAFWDRVSPGGIVQLDDYFAWQGCRKAADEFFVGPRKTTLHRIDDSAVWTRKT